MLYEINKDALVWEFEHLGIYKPAVAIMLEKGRITPLKVLHVRTPAANIIKQEMLAAGGDCATPGAAITCAVPYVDILLLGHEKHYKTLLYKLRQMPYFGLLFMRIRVRPVRMRYWSRRSGCWRKGLPYWMLGENQPAPVAIR